MGLVRRSKGARLIKGQFLNIYVFFMISLFYWRRTFKRCDLIQKRKGKNKVYLFVLKKYFKRGKRQRKEVQKGPTKAQLSEASSICWRPCMPAYALESHHMHRHIKRACHHQTFCLGFANPYAWVSYHMRLDFTQEQINLFTL